jgi:hypothetical protein
MAQIIEEEGARFADPNSLDAQVREYAKLKASMSFMETRQKELREVLFSKIEQEGYEDEKGNVVLDLPQSIEGICCIQKTARVTPYLDETVAERIIEEKGIGDDVYKMVRVIDEGALMSQLYEGKLTEDEIDEMFPKKTVWALMTKKG